MEKQNFDELFGRYRQAVYAFFRPRVQTRTSAEDLAQETWMVVLKGAERYEPRAPFRAYVYGIAFRVLAGEQRKAGSTSRWRLYDRLRLGALGEALRGCIHRRSAPH